MRLSVHGGEVKKKKLRKRIEALEKEVFALRQELREHEFCGWYPTYPTPPPSTITWTLSDINCESGIC